MTAINFVELTEISGEEITKDQLFRMSFRYSWAADHCVGKRVLEVGCGCGQGAVMLEAVADTYVGTDITEELVEHARSRSGARPQSFFVLPAYPLAYGNEEFDVVIAFECLYYFDFTKFLAEARRCLKTGGILLLSLPNREVLGFSPSSRSTSYFSASELNAFKSHGFEVEVFGAHAITTGWLESSKTLLKRMAVTFGLMPKTMRFKRMLKKYFIGDLVQMPDSVDKIIFRNDTLTPVALNIKMSSFRVLYARFRKV